jgi:hypothetical protein
MLNDPEVVPEPDPVRQVIAALPGPPGVRGAA